MKLARRKFLRLAAGAVALPRFAMAQTYPVRPITLIVPFAGPDAEIRIAQSQALSARGQ